jgi:hypothetical protein
MAVERWHYGKLVILWAWAITVTAFALDLLKEPWAETWWVGTPLVLIIVGLPVVFSIVTWRWLTGKERSKE